MNNLNKELQALEAKQAELERQKEELLAKQKEVAKQEAKLQTLYEKSGYKTPRELVEALISKFNLRPSTLLKSSKKAPRRSRTTITASIRDAIKKDLSSGLNKSKTAKKHNISYVVVSKIANGVYDKLK